MVSVLRELAIASELERTLLPTMLVCTVARVRSEAFVVCRVAAWCFVARAAPRTFACGAGASPASRSASCSAWETTLVGGAGGEPLLSADIGAIGWDAAAACPLA